MKILVQNSVFDPQVIGGAEKATYRLAMELEERGYEVCVLATNGTSGLKRDIRKQRLTNGRGAVYTAPAHGLYDIWSPNGALPLHALPLRALHHLASIHSPRWRRLAGRVIDSEKPDIVHTNNLVGMTPTIWKAARERGVPVVHTIHDFHLLCPRTTLLRSDGTACDRTPLPCRLLKRLKLEQTKTVGVVTAPSRFVLREHLAAGGFPRARSLRVANAGEGPRADVPARRRLRQVRGLFLGQLNHHKGVAPLLASLARLRTRDDCAALGFDFAGAGPLAPEVEEFCAAAPDRFSYHGHVVGKRKQALLTEAAFLVLPSTGPDNFPLTMLEAFSNGLPVIAANRGGIPEVVHDGDNGLIIEPTADGLAEAIARYTIDADLRCRHGDAALAASSRYTLDRQVNDFAEIYESLLK